MKPWQTCVGTVALSLGLAGCASEPEGPQNVSGGVSVRPQATEGLATPLVNDTIYLFEDRNFKGDVSRLENVTGKPQGQVYGISDDDSVTSVRWNLPPGAVVLFTQHEDGKGDRVAVWGTGQVNSVSTWNFNDKVSGWAWYDVGGLRSADAIALPPGAAPTTNLPEGTIELFEDRNFKEDMTTIPFVRGQQMGAMQQLPADATDDISSLRWNLPRGVVVILHENADGTGRQLPIWGMGQYDMVPWSFNDKVSRWSWYEVGEPGKTTTKKTTTVIETETTRVKVAE